MEIIPDGVGIPQIQVLYKASRDLDTLHKGWDAYSATEIIRGFNDAVAPLPTNHFLQDYWGFPTKWELKAFSLALAYEVDELRRYIYSYRTKGNANVFYQTPSEWMQDPAFSTYVILDPDGWDRSNFTQDWQRPLTYSEFWDKFSQCTVGPKR